MVYEIVYEFLNELCNGEKMTFRFYRSQFTSLKISNELCPSISSERKLPAFEKIRKH